MIDEHNRPSGEVFETMADRLRAEGRAKAVAAGAARVLLILLKHQRFGTLSDDHLAAINTANYEQIEVWGVRTLSAENLEDVFAD